jgi:hypothetical protein
MALVFENGVWLLQAAAGNTELDKRLSPVAGTPTSIADGATLDATLANGATVHDPGAHFVSIDDNGTDFTMVTNNTADETANGSAWYLASRIWWPTAMMGASNQAGLVGIRVGRGTGLSGYCVGNSNAQGPVSTAATTTNYNWIRFTIVGETVTWYEGGSGASPTWSTFGTAKKFDRAGGARYAYLSCGGNVQVTWSITDWNFKTSHQIWSICMSSLLEEAIVDAKALKEAALKNAENVVLEKYSGEVKKALDTLLEQEDLEEAPVDLEEDDTLTEFTDEVPYAFQNEELDALEEDEIVEIDFDALKERLKEEDEVVGEGDLTDALEMAEDMAGGDPLDQSH